MNHLVSWLVPPRQSHLSSRCLGWPNQIGGDQKGIIKTLVLFPGEEIPPNRLFPAVLKDCGVGHTVSIGSTPVRSSLLKSISYTHTHTCMYIYIHTYTYKCVFWHILIDLAIMVSSDFLKYWWKKMEKEKKKEREKIKVNWMLYVSSYLCFYQQWKTFLHPVHCTPLWHCCHMLGHQHQMQ